MPERSRIRVAAAVLCDGDRVLITQRPAGKAHAGQWEFPGGKIETGEPPLAALDRELREELGIAPASCRPLISLSHSYPEFDVELQFFLVTAWSGGLQAMEGQAMKWVSRARLHDEDILPADKPVLQALNLPTELLITPPCDDEDSWLASLAISLASTSAASPLLQLRQPQLSPRDYEGLVRRLLDQHGVRPEHLILNGPPQLLDTFPEVAGIHLPAAEAARPSGRPVAEGKLLSIAVHDDTELDQAIRLDADLLLISPVKPTLSHPEMQAIGWKGFSGMARNAGRPSYALGGMTPADADVAWEYGGQGVAGIRGFWKS
ncbi:MAG: Nudix family hydrolase [Gammaproteobacteria bacterium]|nr:Nudix family hydrolase [Gammaproteobacteria bacterium]